MSLTRLPTVALLVVGLAVPYCATAQRALSLDVNVGPGYLAGGPDVLSRASMVADGLLTVQPTPGRRSGLLAGMSASWQGPLPSGDKCVLDHAGHCLPDFPHFSSVGVVVGWSSAAGRVRVLGGVASVLATHDDYSPTSDYTIGLPVRLEGVLAKASHLAIVASLRVTLLPRYRGDSYALLASGLGFRLH